MYNENNVMSFDEGYKSLNNLTYTNYYYRLMLLARSVFKYKFPDALKHFDEKWIERYLYHHGKAMFFVDKNIGPVITNFTQDGTLNIYDEPTYITPQATNAESTIFNNLDIRPYKVGEECVIIRNNDIELPTSQTIKLYAMRLAEIQRTIDINIKAQKTPVLVTGSDKQMKSLKIVYGQFDGNKPVIYGDKTLEIDNIKVLSTAAPVVFDKLQIQKHAVFNEAMTFLGINNANMDKRERLVAGEVQANNEQIELSAHCMLKSREMACKQIKELFGYDISVEMRNAAELNLESVKEGITND